MSNRRYAYQREQKSLKRRFLFVIGILFFLIYFALGIVVIFWKQFPLALPDGYRIAFGVLLIVYSFLRFIRLLQSK